MYDYKEILLVVSAMMNVQHILHESTIEQTIKPHLLRRVVDVLLGLALVVTDIACKSW